AKTSFFRHAFFHDGRCQPQFFHELPRFLGGLQFRLQCPAIALFQFAQHISCPFWVVGIDVHWVLLMGSESICFRSVLSAVCIRNPTLPTESFVISLISL